VEDLNSLNGTWVNGARLHAGQQKPLKPGDVIQIGAVQLKLAVTAG
jgi:pSer/pThr/pTyr-binding forkhead associated (FHA) protein